MKLKGSVCLYLTEWSKWENVMLNLVLMENYYLSIGWSSLIISEDFSFLGWNGYRPNHRCPLQQVLYVGDHIYGDILRSKKVLGICLFYPITFFTFTLFSMSVDTFDMFTISSYLHLFVSIPTCSSYCFMLHWAGWRTMLVVPELAREVELLWEVRDSRKVPNISVTHPHSTLCHGALLMEPSLCSFLPSEFIL